MPKVTPRLEQHRAATLARTRSPLCLASVKVDVVAQPLGVFSLVGDVV